MNLYPAIDLYEGRVVRLAQGDFKHETVYSFHPDEQAREWEAQGARWLHVVDLEGAKTGEPKNLEELFKIRSRVRCKIQFGGGLRTVETIQRVLEAGIERVVLGTKALDECFFRQVLERFGPRIAVGLDVRDGVVQTDGWLRKSAQSLQSALEKLNLNSSGTVVYTDIQKDGMLAGPNFQGLRRVLEWTRARVILSGGISGLKDIEDCAALGAANFEGVIIGKALYEKRFSLTDAVRYQNCGK